MTVLNTHKGLFCFNRLPFGVSSAPAIFQRRMDGLLGDIPGVQVYLDDIIIAEKRNDLSRLKQVLQRLREYGLRLHKGKCKFRQDEVTFLGHRIDAKGLRPKDDNMKAVIEAPTPTSVMAQLTDQDAILRKVKEWIAEGWPSSLPQSHEHLRPYFNRRTTPIKDGKSPAELLLGYQIRTKMDCITPDKDRADIQPRAIKTKFNAGDPVWMRSFGSGQRWIPGVVRSHQGSRMLTVESGQGLQRRHLDQLRSRAEEQDCRAEDVNHQEPAAESTPTSSQVDSTSSPGTTTSVQDSPEAAEAGAGHPQTLRKSTRLRRAPDRYGFSPERFTY
ncbi:uncharacterized protein LOC144143327 [Haemaphysalis longicornis]